MKIAVIGLGLIGGSLAKAIKKHYNYTVLGADLNQDVLRAALADGAVDRKLTTKDLQDCDIVLLAIYPQATVE